MMELPKDVRQIIETLENAGYEAYAVGGCVRDMVLKRAPKDWDITTSARPEQVKALFRRTIDTGIEHGTVTVMKNHVGYEVTTYRIDGEYEDSRHPKNVEFTDNLVLDLERRDFTINAMAYHPVRGVVDAFSGMQDIEGHIIRCVGDARARFDEDALRMLRAVRFSGQLGFAIEDKTLLAMKERAKDLQQISAERIRTELVKLLVSKDASQIRVAYQTGMTEVFFPEFDKMMGLEQKNPHHIYTVGEHTIHSIEAMNYFFGEYSNHFDFKLVSVEAKTLADKLVEGLTAKQHSILCAAMLFHDIGKPDAMTIDEVGIGHFHRHQKISEQIADRVLKRLTFDNETISLVKRLVCWHDYRFSESSRAMRRAVSKIGKDLMPLLFLVQMSDALAQNPMTIEEKLQRICSAAKLWQDILLSKAALELKDLQISGKDLLDIGIPQGPELGKLLKMALEYVLEEPERNKKEFLLEWIGKNFL
ncbi:MAG: CCA tRNA nucleotidyltransferase [Lachnospiraceae bacterium]|nr:CCA tRNA nucleotidyltransferase [Lachnospiraceae bacterium]